MRVRPLLAVGAVWAVAAVACAPSLTASSSQAGRPATPAPVADVAHSTLVPAAIRQAVTLGPAGVATQVYLNLGLRGRQPQRLAALLAAGGTVTPADYVSEFGPDPEPMPAVIPTIRWAWPPGLVRIACAVGGRANIPAHAGVRA